MDCLLGTNYDTLSRRGNDQSRGGWLSLRMAVCVSIPLLPLSTLVALKRHVLCHDVANLLVHGCPYAQAIQRIPSRTHDTERTRHNEQYSPARRA